MGPLHNPTDPFRDAIRLVSGREPPDYVRGWEISPEQSLQLQCWLADIMETTATPWGTGIGALEAAESIVAEAVANGNIWHPSDSRWRR